MQQFIDSINQALMNRNWYVALFSCLTLPDICANIEYPNSSSSQRYVNWFNQYMLSKYTSHIGPDRQEHVFLSGGDCYALRCSYLHEGSSDISQQRIQQVLTNFQFIPPITGMYLHCNQAGSILQLQVDVFCKDVIDAVNSWLNVAMNDSDKKQKIESLLRIGTSGPVVNFS